MLGDLHLLDGLPEAGAIPGAVLAGDPNLLGTLGHLVSLTSESNHSESSCLYSRGKHKCMDRGHSMWLLRPCQETDYSGGAHVATLSSLPHSVLLSYLNIT